jgi:hypothetical protein
MIGHGAESSRSLPFRRHNAECYTDRRRPSLAPVWFAGWRCVPCSGTAVAVGFGWSRVAAGGWVRRREANGSRIR